MNHKTMSKVFAVNLSLALAVTSAPVPVGALGPVGPAAPAFVAKLTPPEQFGYVASSYAPKGEEHPRLVVIANLHGHLEVQNNVIGMLEHYVNKLTSEGQARVPIYLEGAWEKKMEHPLAPIIDQKLRAVLAEYMLRKVEMQAVQAFTERHPNATNVTVTGVDNKEEYERNRMIFAKTYSTRKLLLEAIIRQEQGGMAELEDFVASPTYQKLRQMRGQYEKGLITAERFSRALVRLARRYGMADAQVDALRNSGNMSAGEFELALLDVYRRLLVKVSEASRPAASYFRRALREEKLVKRNLAYSQGYMDLMKRLLSNQLTPEEVAYATKHFGQLVKVAEALLAGEKLGVDIAGALQDALSFYSFVFLRDDSLVRNALAELDKDDTHAKTGILVIGGFHSGYIVDYLRDRQVPYVQIHPSITRDVLATEQLNYVKRLCNVHVTAEEAAMDFRQPWVDQLVQETTGRLSASTADIAGGEVTRTGLGIVDPSKGPMRLRGFNLNGVVDHRAMHQGTEKGKEFFSEGQLLGELGSDALHRDVALAVQKAQVKVEINDRSRSALFRLGGDGQWAGEGKNASLFGGIVRSVADSKMVDPRMKLDLVDEIEIMLTDSKIETYDKDGKLAGEDDMMVLQSPTPSASGKKRAIILLHKSEDEITTHNEALEELRESPREKPTAKQKAAVEFDASLRHELGHVTSKPGWHLGDYAQSYVDLNMIVSEVASMAGVEAVETASVPLPVLRMTLRGMEPLLANMGLSSDAILGELGSARTVTLGQLRDAVAKLMRALDPVQIEQRQQALIENLVNMGLEDKEAQLIVSQLPLFPRITGQLTPAQERYVIGRVMGWLKTKGSA